MMKSTASIGKYVMPSESHCLAHADDLWVERSLYIMSKSPFPDSLVLLELAVANKLC